MRVVFGNLEAEVSTELVSVSKLTQEPMIVQLVKEHKQVCEACPTFAETKGNCPLFPFCPYVQVKQWTVPRYPTGVVQTEKGEVTVFEDGKPCPTYGRRYYVVLRDNTLRPVREDEYKGYEVVEAGEGSIRVEERAPFSQSTSTIDIREDNLYPAGVETNFLVESTYELFAKPSKKPDETVRNTRRLYEIVRELARQNKIVIKTDFVWKTGTYKSWAVILEPVMFDNGKFLLTMKTTGANLKWLHAMTVPPEMPATPATAAPKVNNLKALGSFLEGVKKKAEPQTHPLQVQDTQRSLVVETEKP